MLSKIIPLIEKARGDRPVYVEPFGGSGAVINSLKPVEIEVYNDVDERLVDFFRALIDDDARKKMVLFGETFPQSRAIYDEMKRDWINSPELAKRGFAVFYVQNFSFGGMSFDSYGYAKGATYIKKKDLAAAYKNKSSALDAFAERFRFVNVEALDWRQVVDKYDSANAFFYFDPPYICNSNSYKKDLAPVDHAELVARLLTLQGGAALSCYDNDVYKPLLEAGWERHDFAASSSVRRSTDNLGDARKRVETLYIKPLVKEGRE